jgi:hypothetical protein
MSEPTTTAMIIPEGNVPQTADSDTSAAIPLLNEPLKMSGSHADRESRAQTLVTLFVKFLSDHIDLLVQVRQDFLDKETDATIMGCKTFGEYCKNVLHYSESHIRRLLAGRNPATATFNGQPQKKFLENHPKPTACPECHQPFASKSQLRNHGKTQHGIPSTEVAAFLKRACLPTSEDAMVTVQEFVDTPQPGQPTQSVFSSKTAQLRDWFNQKYPAFKLKPAEKDLRGVGGRMGRYDLTLFNLTPAQVKAIGGILQ